MGHWRELYANYTKYTPSLGPRVPPWVTRSLYKHLQKAHCVLGEGSVLRAGGTQMEAKNTLTSYIFAQYLSFLLWKTDRAFVIKLQAGFSFPEPRPQEHGGVQTSMGRGRWTGRADNEKLGVIVQ